MTSTETSEYVKKVTKQQIKNAKEQFRAYRFVEPSTVSSYYSMIRWKDLLTRYRRFCHYVNEVKPGWREIKRTGFADNSVEVVQISNTGEKRTVLVYSPSGDCSF